MTQTNFLLNISEFTLNIFLSKKLNLEKFKRSFLQISVCPSTKKRRSFIKLFYPIDRKILSQKRQKKLAFLQPHERSGYFNLIVFNQRLIHSLSTAYSTPYTQDVVLDEILTPIYSNPRSQQSTSVYLKFIKIDLRAREKGK